MREGSSWCCGWPLSRLGERGEGKGILVEGMKGELSDRTRLRRWNLPRPLVELYPWHTTISMNQKGVSGWQCLIVMVTHHDASVCRYQHASH